MLLTTEGTEFHGRGTFSRDEADRMVRGLFEQKDAKETKRSVRFQLERSSPPRAH